MKRKSLAAILMASLMLSLTACGGDKADTTASTDTATETSQETDTADTQTEAEPEAEKEEESKEEEQAEEQKEEEKEEEKEESEGAYTKGSVDDSGFQSEWLGIRYDAPDGFVMSTEEELEALLQAGGELVYEDEAQTFIDYAKMTTVYEMMTYLPQPDGAGNPNLSLVVEKNDMSAGTYGAAVKLQMDAMYADAETEWQDVETVSVAGLDCEKYQLAIDFGDQKMIQAYYIGSKEGRIICFILSYTDTMQSEADALMDAFKPL